MTSLDLWANLLRAVDYTGVEERNLPARLCSSKRAVRTRLNAAIRHGWVEEETLGRGDKIARLTPAGSEVAFQKDLQNAGIPLSWRDILPPQTTALWPDRCQRTTRDTSRGQIDH